MTGTSLTNTGSGASRGWEIVDRTVLAGDEELLLPRLVAHIAQVRLGCSCTLEAQAWLRHFRAHLCPAPQQPCQQCQHHSLAPLQLEHQLYCNELKATDENGSGLLDRFAALLKKAQSGLDAGVAYL